MGGQYGSEGATQWVRRQRRPGPPVGLRAPTYEIGATGRQYRGTERRGTESVIPEEEPTPSGVQQQVDAERRHVAPRLAVLSRCAQPVDGDGRRGRDVAVERGPHDGECRPGWLVRRLAKPGVPRRHPL